MYPGSPLEVIMAQNTASLASSLVLKGSNPWSSCIHYKTISILEPYAVRS